MADSPLLNSEGPVSVTVTSEGAAIADSVQLISVTVRRALNKVPTATLVISDGDMPEQTFPVSDSATFKPGAAIVISAGYNGNVAVIFSGIVVRHSLSIAGANDARLTVECRDKAVKMTVGRKSKLFTDQTDSAALQALIGGHDGLTAEVQSTSISHTGLVQHYSSDWDFLLSRAEACGSVVVVDDGKVTVKPPDVSAAAALSVAYGDSLMDFHADLDARHQYASVKAQAWDPATQALLQAEAAQPAALNAQGDIDSATLAQVLGIASVDLQTAALWTKETLDGWVKAQQLKSGLARLRGHMRFQGSALAKVGGLIELAGVGTRFNGTVYVSGLTHQIEDGTWTTEADFGTPVEWFSERTDIQAPPASGLLPGIDGLYVGVVKKLDADPGSENRIQVSVPSANLDGVWARLLQPYASDGFGFFWLPEVGDEVLLGWFNNDPDFPVVLGSLYSSKRKPPYALAADNDTKAFVTRSKCKLEINDKDKIITLTTPGNNKVVLDDKDKSILLSDQNGNTVKLSDAGIALDSPKDIKLTAKGGITLDAVNAIEITSKADVKVAGLNINCEAQVGIVAKGSASAELSAAGQTTVKGAMVMIN
jgi:Rhs element Vgr protein